MAIHTKRIYEPPSPEDGYRLLVMRLWPRGVKKGAVDGWEKDLGPSRELLTSFRAGKIAWEDLAARYREEMSTRGELLERYRDLARQQTLTLLCSCQDETHCHRSLLKQILESKTT
jgi:ribokinase